MRLQKLEGEVVANRFRLREMVGKGGYGAVFEAVQLSVDRRCAVKILLPGRSDDVAVEKRFRAEARATSRLAHPNSLVLYDFGVDEELGFLFLATEFLDGDTLHAVLKKDAPFTVERTIAILAQVAASLDDAHSQGLVHRDVKTKNIMLVERAQRTDFVKVIDFGIAKAICGEMDGQTALTQTGMLIGTPQYMAPEQMLGDDIDGRTDQYALAVVGYRMLTGRNPFRAETPMETAMRHLNDKPMPLRTYRRELKVNRKFEEAFLRALDKSPGRRFSCVTDFVDALEQAQNSSKWAGTGISLPESARRARQAKTVQVDINPEDYPGLYEESDVTVEKPIERDAEETVEEPIECDAEETVEELPTECNAEETVDELPSTREIVRAAPASISESTIELEIVDDNDTSTKTKTKTASLAEIQDDKDRSTRLPHIGMPAPAVVVAAAVSLVLFAGSAMAVILSSSSAGKTADRPAVAQIAMEDGGDNAEDDGKEVEYRPSAVMPTIGEARESMRQSLGSAQKAARKEAKKRAEQRDEERRRLAEQKAETAAREKPPPKKVRPPEPAEVTATLIPWGTLYVNGERQSNATRQQVTLQPGRHELTLRQQGTVRATQTVDVAPGESKMVVLEVNFDQ